MVSVLAKPEFPEPCRFDLQVLQRLGSFLKFLSWKKCCSPAVNTKSAPQSIHLRTRSWNSGIATVPRYQLELFTDEGGEGPARLHVAIKPHPPRLLNLPAILL